MKSKFVIRDLEFEYMPDDDSLEIAHKGSQIGKIDMDETENLSKWLSEVTWKMYGY